MLLSSVSCQAVLSHPFRGSFHITWKVNNQTNDTKSYFLLRYNNIFSVSHLHPLISQLELQPHFFRLNIKQVFHRGSYVSEKGPNGNDVGSRLLFSRATLQTCFELTNYLVSLRFCPDRTSNGSHKVWSSLTKSSILIWRFSSTSCTLLARDLGSVEECPNSHVFKKSYYHVFSRIYSSRCTSIILVGDFPLDPDSLKK